MAQATRPCFLAAWLALACITFSCNTVQQNQTTSAPATATIDNIDGTWRHAAVGEMPAVCLTITSRRVTQLDPGCTGANWTIFAKPPAPNNGSNVTLIVSAGPDPNDQNTFSIFTYQLVTRSDGSMRGPASIQSQPSGAIVGAREVILVRQ